MTELKEYGNAIKKHLENEDPLQMDPLFRFGVLGVQTGKVGRYLIHDQTRNPSARPHGSPDDKIVAHGEVIYHSLAQAISEGISPTEALEMAMSKVHGSDWKKVIARQLDGPLRGRIPNYDPTNPIYPTSGVAFVDPKGERLNELDGGILVTSHFTPDYVNILGSKKLDGIVTDHGGVTSHAALLAIERNIPCLVSTGHATQYIQHGQEVVISPLDKRDEEGNNGEVSVITRSLAPPIETEAKPARKTKKKQ